MQKHYQLRWAKSKKFRLAAGREECVVSYWEMYRQLLKGILSVTRGCIVSSKGYVYRQSLKIYITLKKNNLI